MVGPSGSGKTTILNLIGGLDTRDRRPGLVRRSGDHRASRPAELTRYRRETVGFVFQFYNLVPNLTAAENVMVATELSRDPMAVAEALRLVGLEERMRTFPLAAFRRRTAARGDCRARGQEPALLAVRRADRGLGFRHRQARAADAGRLQTPASARRSC